MGRTERSDLRSWTNCHSCRRRARIRRASVPLVAERSLIGMQMRMGVQAPPPAAAAPRQEPTEMSDPPCRLLSMDWKISELVAIPVTDVDRAKEFYRGTSKSFHADHDYQVTETLRFVQLTPPGSACSIVMGTGITEMAPGTQKGVRVVVADVEGGAARN